MATLPGGPRGEEGDRGDWAATYGSLYHGHSLAELYVAFYALGIETRTEIYHEQGLRNGMDGIFCKNLLLKDRRGQFYYIICFEDWKADLKLLKSKLSAHRNFSFATPSDIEFLLSLGPGNISPFGLLNQNSESIRVIIDERLTTTSELLNFHPLVANLTTLISYKDLVKFVSYCGHSFEKIIIE